MSPTLLIALTLGTLVMLVIMWICRRWVTMGKLKTVIFAVLLTACGLASVKIMAFIESGDWNGLSFFGAVFLEPVFLLLLSVLLREKWGTLLDLSAPSICGMLMVMKAECLRSGCCKGRILFKTAEGVVVRFPSQIVELLVAVALAVFLIRLMRDARNEGKIYPIFMVSYGAVRFILNLCRATSPFVWILPAGNFWSLIAIAIGIVWLSILKSHINKKR
jgi:prolipoprotein diacylglyceryltransferase